MMPLLDTKPFIDLGWHTIPLGGELKRLPNGKKTVPIFGKEWLERGLRERNMQASPLGGAITGKESRIIALDCDNSITYNLFKALDPTYEFHFMSNGKRDSEGNEQVCGTIVYEYVEQLEESFKVVANSLALDFLSNGRMTYLPTQANTTKYQMDKLPKLKPPPPEILALLKSIQTAKQAQPTTAGSVSSHKFNLAPQVEMFVKSAIVTKSLFRLLTPKDFRDELPFKTHGFLHPNEVPDGRGSEYLSKLSAILGADISIDVDMYSRAMDAINDQFSDPMSRKRLLSTVIEPMCEGRSTGPTGQPIWQEDPNWQEAVLTFLTKHKTVVHTFYDYDRCVYYVTDLAEEKIQTFATVQSLSAHLDSITLEGVPIKELKATIPNINAGSEPEKLFGFYSTGHLEKFNTFISTDAYKIFKQPEEYAEFYNKPTITLQFLEELVPDPEMRYYLLGFLRRKLDTFEYSPVILYFLGVAGSGKDTLVNLIEDIIGETSMERPTSQMFLEKNNAWILDKLFVQLDEYGDTLSGYAQKQEAMGLLKQYTGKSRISVRVMRENVFSYDHKVTFIMTANSNPLMLDGDDRRIALFNCPNKLLNADWLYAAGDIDTVIASIKREVNDFAYYLSTEVKNLDKKAYMTPPVSADKIDMIAANMPISRRMFYYLTSKNWAMFRELVDVYGTKNMLDKAKDNKLIEDDLVYMYEEMKGDVTPDARPVNIIRSAAKDAGVTVTRTTLLGNRHGYIYHIPGLYQILNMPGVIQDEDI